MTDRDHIRTAAALLDDDLVFPRARKHGQRRVATMWRDWGDLRRAVASGDPADTQAAFDACEPWIDWCFQQASEGQK